MKKLSIALMVMLGLACGANAQEATVEGISVRSFTGVKSINNGEYFYTFYFGEKTETKGMANFILALYDADLKLVKTTTIEISKDSRLAGSAFNGKYFFFEFADLAHKKRTTVTMDKDGSIIKNDVEEKVRPALLTIENTPDIHALGDDFLVIRPERDKKFGYELSKMDKDQNVNWTKSFFPEKGSWSIEDSRLANGNLYILREGKEALIGNKYIYAVQGINLTTGDQIYLTELADEDDGGFPGFINVKEDGTVATGGMYFKNGRYDEKNSDGLFFTVLGADGKIAKTSKTSWKKVKDEIKGDFSTALFGGKTRVLVEDVIQKKDGTYMVITETWRKGAADETGSGTLNKLGKLGGLGGGGAASNTDPGDKGFTVMDFALFNFDANGVMTSIDRIEKPTKEAIIKGAMADESPLALATILYKRKFFCYRSTIEVNGKQYIMYKNLDGYKTKAYFLPVGATSVSGIGQIDMDKWLSDGLNKMGQITKWSGNTNKATFENPGAFENTNPELYKNIIPAKPGQVLLYDIKQDKMTMWLQPIPAI